MNKLDMIKDFFDCDICENLLIDPISLPCGKNVCNHHLQVVVYKIFYGIFCIGKKFCFEICNDKHYVPEKGHFIVNKHIWP